MRLIDFHTGNLIFFDKFSINCKLSGGRPVYISFGGMYPFAQLGQDTAQSVSGHPSHDRRMGCLHTFKQLGGGEAKHFLRIVLFCSKAKAKAEHLFFGYMLVE